MSVNLGRSCLHKNNGNAFYVVAFSCPASGSDICRITSDTRSRGIMTLCAPGDTQCAGLGITSLRENG